MGARIFTTVLVLAALLMAGPARSSDDLVARWYALLVKADGPGLASLLSDDARINLNDLGVEQSKAEFIATMDEWAEAVVGAAIRHRVETTVGDVTTVLACYDFASNDMLIRETFTIRDGLIVDNTQTGVAETCDL